MNAKKLHIYIKNIPDIQCLFEYDRVSTLGFLYTVQSSDLACKIMYYIVILIFL